MWCDSEPGVDTVGIYVENNCNRCREFFMLIRFDNMKLGEKGFIPLLLEDLLILQFGAPEESVSHHIHEYIILCVCEHICEILVGVPSRS